jgi:phosphate acetyltransferase
MDLIDQFIEQAKRRSGSVVLPEAHDPRIVQAARRLVDNDIATPILLGKRDRVEVAAREADVSLDAIELIQPTESDRIEAFAREYSRNRRLKDGIARRMVRKSLFFGGMMVACGDADTMVAGVTNATATVSPTSSMSGTVCDGMVFTVPRICTSPVVRPT